MTDQRDQTEPEKAQRADGGEPAQEWGGRVETGKEIARGGKTEGTVPGGEAQSPAEGPRQGG